MTLALVVRGFELSMPAAVLGLVIGSVYGLLAVGLVLIYRSSKIINFAHGEIGAFAAAVLGVVVIKYRFPYWLAFPLALAVAAAVGAIVETAAIRRLKNAPRLMAVVATLGVSQVLFFAGQYVVLQSTARSRFPSPPGLPAFELGGLRITPAFFGMLVFSPIAGGLLALFLSRSRAGLQIRASAANPQQAAISGVYPARMSTLVWAIGGALSALTAILLMPSRGSVAGESLGPALLLRALAPAVLARLNNLPGAFAGGLLLGVVEQQLLWNFPSGGEVEVMLFALVLLILLGQSKYRGQGFERSAWSAVQPWPPLRQSLMRVRSIRNLNRIVGAAALMAALMVSVFANNSQSSVLTVVASFSLVGISVGLLSGLAGDLSLGQFALAGIGATAAYHLSNAGWHFLPAFLAAGLAAAAASVLIGLPALRVRGLMLAVVTLGFALAAERWLFGQPWMLGDGVRPPPIKVAGQELSTGKKYYFLALAFLLAGMWLARNLRSGSFGRSLIALRDNHDAARAFGVPSVRRRLEAFAAAGFFSGLGGAIFAYSLSFVSMRSFPAHTSVDIVAMTAIGGIAILAGPILGALYIIGLPTLIPLDTAALAATRLGWLVLILYAPGGLAQWIRPARDRLVGWLARRAGESSSPGSFSAERVDETLPGRTSDRISGMSSRIRAHSSLEEPASPVLKAESLTKHFGGISAVNDVSFEIAPYETVGIIGPNGAGKTTLFNLLSGFGTQNSGRVYLFGNEVTNTSPETRSKMGMGRSFQDAYLFPTMTVFQAVVLAAESQRTAKFWSSVAGIVDHKSNRRAAEMVEAMGLEAYRDTSIGALSTGTRRIVELACMLCLEPSVLLLDEPSAGISQKEAEALGPLLEKVRDRLGAALLIIEHNIPMVSLVAGRLIAMDAGEVIADGPTAEVLASPAVEHAYLGSKSSAKNT